MLTPCVKSEYHTGDISTNKQRTFYCFRFQSRASTCDQLEGCKISFYYFSIHLFNVICNFYTHLYNLMRPLIWSTVSFSSYSLLSLFLSLFSFLLQQLQRRTSMIEFGKGVDVIQQLKALDWLMNWRYNRERESCWKVKGWKEGKEVAPKALSPACLIVL